MRNGWTVRETVAENREKLRGCDSHGSGRSKSIRRLRGMRTLPLAAIRREVGWGEYHRGGRGIEGCPAEGYTGRFEYCGIVAFLA